MARLKNRQMQIPGGFKFYQPQTRWQAPSFASFDTIVTNLISHRQANPNLKLATDRATVEIEVDEFNARICEQGGWNDYIQANVGGAPPPFLPAPSQIDQSKLSAAVGAAKKIWAGVRTLNDWLDGLEKTQPPFGPDLLAPPEQSAKRAATCAACPKNAQGDFTSWFTRPASEAIKAQLERGKKLDLTTPSDATLNVCDVCLCPMKLKVHTPLSFINNHLSQPVLDELAAANSNCWIVQERKA